MLGKFGNGLEGWTDADGMTTEGRQPVSGYIFKFLGSPVSWASKRQELVTLSTTEAEYIALSYAGREAIWLSGIVEVVLKLKLAPITIHCDNQSAIANVKDNKFHARTKHIDIRYHFIRWILEDKKIVLEYCPTGDMVADVLTKALPSAKVKHFASALGLRQT